MGGTVRRKQGSSFFAKVRYLDAALACLDDLALPASELHYRPALTPKLYSHLSGSLVERHSPPSGLAKSRYPSLLRSLECREDGGNPSDLLETLHRIPRL